jgi:outer membrane receptor protein involved in Fe transport
MKLWVCALLLLSLFVCGQLRAQTNTTRTLSGTIVSRENKVVAGLRVIVRSSVGEQETISDSEGNFRLLVPDESLRVKIEGENIAAQERVIGKGEAAENLRFEVRYIVPPIHESLIITATQLDPSIDRRNDTVYRNTLFARDDQVFHTLDAGISIGQHEGGGKSLEVRRFGFNLDHGGVNGGLKVLLDNVQQNQGTQGHGQGYLGQLKSLSPELVEDVEIFNGPFSAQYGDFSGLGVVHIRLKERLPDQLTARLQGGSFGSFRSFLAYSPELKNDNALIAYESSRTDGPFKNPLQYKRDNVTGNYIRQLRPGATLGFKFNFGRNDFSSSGQIPLDEVAAGRLDRFGFLDPDNGGRVRSGVFSAYFKSELSQGSFFKLDGFVARSLFDLYSNFTFFLNDEVNGDEIQQHDSRLQEGANAQYLRSYQIFGQRALIVAGANLHDNRINVGLFPSLGRVPQGIVTKANAHVSNMAGYAQQSLELWHGHLQLEGGLRYDYFRFQVDDKIDPQLSGAQSASQLQPKFNLAVTPSDRLLLTIYFNYGRGISSQDARGVVQKPEGPKISRTDFYQLGTAHNFRRVSLATDLFLIDRSNEQVYIPDDGSIEFKGPSRAYGFEVKSSLHVTRSLSFNGSLMRVMNAFFRGTEPRIYLDSAPNLTASAALTLAGWHGLSASLRYRHISSYRLDGEDPTVRASGFDVLDLSLTKEIRRGVEFNLSVDNLSNKRYYETQNYFESRLRPGDPVVARIHGTPGYPITLTLGLTFRLLRK